MPRSATSGRLTALLLMNRRSTFGSLEHIVAVGKGDINTFKFFLERSLWSCRTRDAWA